jgi:hypothetical protein
MTSAENRNSGAWRDENLLIVYAVEGYAHRHNMTARETAIYVVIIEQLAVRKLFSQMAFATEKSLSLLHFTGYREIAPWNH